MILPIGYESAEQYDAEYTYVLASDEKQPVASPKVVKRVFHWADVLAEVAQ